MSRFVFDTNVMVSALLLNDSVPGQAFIRGLNHGTILISTETVSELSRVLGRDRFARYISQEKRDEFLQSLIREADLIEITESVDLAVSGVSRPSTRFDDKFLKMDLAVSGNATYVKNCQPKATPTCSFSTRFEAWRKDDVHSRAAIQQRGVRPARRCHL